MRTEIWRAIRVDGTVVEVSVAYVPEDEWLATVTANGFTALCPTGSELRGIVRTVAGLSPRREKNLLYFRSPPGKNRIEKQVPCPGRDIEEVLAPGELPKNELIWEVDRLRAGRTDLARAVKEEALRIFDSMNTGFWSNFLVRGALPKKLREALAAIDIENPKRT